MILKHRSQNRFLIVPLYIAFILISLKTSGQSNLWTKIFDFNNNHSYLRHVGIDNSGNIVLTGDVGFLGRTYAAKYRPDGSLIWESDQHLGRTGGNFALPTSDAGLLVGGYHYPNGGYLTKLDSLGNKIWARDTFTSVSGFVPIGDSDFIIAHNKEITKIDSAGNFLWRAFYDASKSYTDVVQTLDRNFVVVGWESGFIGSTAFIKKFDGQRNQIWHYDLTFSRTYSVLATADSGVIVKGGGGTITLNKIDKDGNLVWNNNLNSSYGLPNVGHELDKMVRTASNRFSFVGRDASSSGNGAADAYTLFNFDDDGNLRYHFDLPNIEGNAEFNYDQLTYTDDHCYVFGGRIHSPWDFE